MVNSYTLKNCKDCSELESLQSDIDKKITDMTRKLYFKKVYLSQQSVCTDSLSELIRYKYILVKMNYNSATFQCVATRKEIISQIKKLLY